MQKITHLLMFLFLSAKVYSQNNAVVSGKVHDARSGKPIEFASALLKSKTDSTIKLVTATDSAGNFSFENAATGSWILKLSFVGYHIRDTVVSLSENSKKINLGTITLRPAITSLDGITITEEQQKAVEFSIDKKVYNVGKDIQAETGSATDVLQNIPSVQVDIDGTISLRGSGNVLILLNGKPSPILAKNPAEALQSFPASSIERIEVITNPSAKYKPDGTGGIINIVLKQNTKQGVNGSITLNAGNNDRYNGNVSLSYKPGKVNLYGTFGVRQNTHVRESTIRQTNYDSLTHQITGFYNEDNVRPGKAFSQSGVFGLDYEADSSNTLSLSCNYFHLRSDRTNTSVRTTSDSAKMPESEYTRVSLLKPSETEIENTVSWQHKFKKEDHELSFECVKVLQVEHENSRYTNCYSLPAAGNIYDNIFLDKTDNPMEVTLDYTNPLSEDATIEAGYAGTFNDIVMDYRGEYFDPLSDAFIKDTSTSYHFLYKDMRNAAYFTWEKGIEDFGFLLGLRAEQVNLEGDVTNVNSTFKNDYFSLYPTIHIKFELGKTEFGLSYSRRVNRPDGDELNPFPEFDDPRQLNAGNPGLLPEYVHSVELGSEMKGKKFTFMPTLYYRYTYNGFTTVTKSINDSTLLTTQENLATREDAGLELIFSKKIGNWFSGNLSSDISYAQFDASNLGYSSKRSALSAFVNLGSNIAVAKRTALQVNCLYHSGEVTPQGKFGPMWYLNVGGKQELWKNKLAVVVTLNDVFKSQGHHMELNTASLSQTTRIWRNSRVFFIGIKYRFGSMVKKAKEEIIKFDNSEK